MRVAIQGEAGSNSHAAVERLLDSGHTLVPCALSADVFEHLTVLQDADAAVLPIENSLHGAVADHSELLLKYGVQIAGEYQLKIEHALVAAPGVSFAQIRRVLSHPVALSQCRKFFAKHPEMEAVPFYDTAGAVKHVMQTRATGEAAIARDMAADVYGGEILQRGLEDDPQNFTRFFLLARPEDVEKLRPTPEVNKMSVAFAIPHRPGSLVAVLQSLANLGVDLTRIESRPVPGKPWEYVFFVDLRLANSEAADAVMSALHANCSMAKELGRYAAASMG